MFYEVFQVRSTHRAVVLCRIALQTICELTTRREAVQIFKDSHSSPCVRTEFQKTDLLAAFDLLSGTAHVIGQHLLARRYKQQPPLERHSDRAATVHAGLADP